MNRIYKILIPALVASLMICDFSQAQISDQQRARRRALMEDLLKGLIESQAGPEDHDDDHGHDHDQQVRPGRPVTQPTRPGGMRPVVEVSRDMVQARGHLKKWKSASENLVSELRFHAHESPALPPLLADAVEIQASINVLNNKAQLYPTVQPIISDFAAIDQQWRILSNRLKQSGALSSDCLAFVSTISDLDNNLLNLFDIEPQLDRQQLMRLTTDLNSNYKHLLQDIYYQARGKQGGDKIIRQGQELYTLINQASSLISRGSYEAIVAAYQQCNTDWKKFSINLRKFSDQRIQRDVQQIESLGRQIHEQLWLPTGMDREYTAHLVDTVANQAKTVFGTVTINQLMACEQPNQVLKTIQQFQGSAKNFSQHIAAGETQAELSQDFAPFAQQWDNLHDTFHKFKDPKIDFQLEEIDYTMSTLRETFGTQTQQIDYASLVQLAANLDQQCHHFSEEVDQRITVNRYGNAFQNSFGSQAENLHDMVHDFHSQLISQRGANVDRNQLNGIFQQWANMKAAINQCKPEDRRVLLELRRQIEPLMVKLQIVFLE